MRGRRKRKPELGGSLFPFLSVLACVIGTLTLLLASLAIGQVASGLEGDAESRSPHERRGSLRDEVAALEARQQAAEKERARRDRARAALQRLGLSADAELESRVAVRVAAAERSQRLERLEREQDNVDAEIAALRAELGEAKSRREGARIAILPGGSGPPLEPFFVECLSDRLRVYSRDESWSLPLRLGTPEGDDDFETFLKRVRAERDGTVVFLIRPDGVAQYSQAAEKAGRYYVRHAKLPLPGPGELDLSRF